MSFTVQTSFDVKSADAESNHHQTVVLTLDRKNVSLIDFLDGLAAAGFFWLACLLASSADKKESSRSGAWHTLLF